MGRAGIDDWGSFFTPNFVAYSALWESATGTFYPQRHATLLVQEAERRITGRDDLGAKRQEPDALNLIATYA